MLGIEKKICLSQLLGVGERDSNESFPKGYKIFISIMMHIWDTLTE